MKKIVWCGGAALLLSVLFVQSFDRSDTCNQNSLSSWSLEKCASIKHQAAAAAQNVYDFFADHELGDVYYYTSMASNAQPIKEQIAGQFLINAAYYKFVLSGVRKMVQALGTKARLCTWFKGTEGIRNFIQQYNIDMTEYVHEKPEEFADFNDFFYRKLKSGTRKIDARDAVVACPADSKLRVLTNLSPSSKFFIKQKPFDVAQFLGDAQLAKHYEGGSMFVFRLAPPDYHRFHFPFDCAPCQPVFIQGDYETVNSIAFRTGLWPISINKRAYVTLHSEQFGDVIMMVVGASMVGSINFTYTPGDRIKKGDEAGFFAFGGSTVCLLFKKDVVVVPDVLLARSRNEEVDKMVDGNVNRQLIKQVAPYEKNTAFETAVLVGQGVAMQSGSGKVNRLSSAEYCAFLKGSKTVFSLDGEPISFVWNNTKE